MDTSIRPVTPRTDAQTRRRCVRPCLTLDDHGMNPGAAAIADWKSGWLARHYEVVVERRQLQGCPP